MRKLSLTHPRTLELAAQLFCCGRCFESWVRDCLEDIRKDALPTVDEIRARVQALSSEGEVPGCSTAAPQQAIEWELDNLSPQERVAPVLNS